MAVVTTTARILRNDDTTLVFAAGRAYKASRGWYGRWIASSGPLDETGRPDLTVDWESHGTHLSRTWAEAALAAVPELAAVLADLEAQVA